MLHDNYILCSIIGKKVHMQDSIASGIHEGFYNLPFYRLLSNGSLPKLPAHTEDMETTAIQYVIPQCRQRPDIFLYISWVLNLAIKFHIYTVSPSIFYLGEPKLWNRAIAERNNLLCKQNCATHNQWMAQVHFKILHGIGNSHQINPSSLG